MYVALVVGSVVLLAMSAGALYGFSSFVMSGLDLAGGQAAGEGMSGINRTAVRAPFMSLFLGAPLVTAAAAVTGFVTGDDGAGWLVAATVLYLLGVVGVTGARNVPLNDRLVAAADKAAVWRDNYRAWMAWNHVRVIAAAVAAVLAAVVLL